MERNRSALAHLVRELVRRKVRRTAAIYATAGFALLGFVDIVFPLIGLGPDLQLATLLLLVAGFPAALLTAWFLEVDDGRVRRRRDPTLPAAARLLATTLLALIVLATGAGAMLLPGRAGQPTGEAPPARTGEAAWPRGEPEPYRPEPVRIRIVEPPEWGGPESATAAIQPGGSVRVRGTASHPHGVIEVLLNGRRVPVSRRADGTALFEGRIGAEDARFGDAVIVVRSGGGGIGLASYPVRLADAPAAAEATAATPPAPTARAAARTPAAEIEIHLPTEWAGPEPRPAPLVPRQALRVVGLARADTFISDVRLDAGWPTAQALATQYYANRAIVQFSGFIDPDSAGTAARLLVRTADGRSTVREFPLRRPAAPAALPEARPGARQRFAVVIGIGRYANPVIRELRFAAEDARAFYDFLRSPAAGMGGVPARNIRLLTDGEATARNVRAALLTFLRQSTPDDVIIVFIAAHGSTDPRRPQDFYIVTHDTDPADLAATAIPVGLLNDAMRQAYAYNRVVITDVAHTAGIPPEPAAGSARTALDRVLVSESLGGLVVFTAAETGQSSRIGEQWGGSLFTHHLLEGLRGRADRDGDGIVTLAEMMSHTRDNVRRTTRNAQIPTISATSYDAQFPMAVVLPPP